ncbi:unnamed protein product [Amoebophrya sp. A120]|nr:unnamed protein product [Amoebophrya sp. A120]|eukprot:GSA120T00004103001.1
MAAAVVAHHTEEKGGPSTTSASNDHGDQEMEEQKQHTPSVTDTLMATQKPLAIQIELPCYKGASKPDGTQRYTTLQLKLLCGGINFFHRHIRTDKDVKQRMRENEAFPKFYEEQYHYNKQDTLPSVFRTSVHDTSALHVSSFILSILHQGIFSVSAFVISIIYLSRFKECSHITLHATTWRPLFLVTLLISDKMWEDKPVRNSSLAKLFPVLNNKELNLLENSMLQSLGFNVLVKPDLFCSFCEKLLMEAVSPEIVEQAIQSDFGQGLMAEPYCVRGIAELQQPMTNVDLEDDIFGCYPTENCLQADHLPEELYTKMLVAKGQRAAGPTLTTGEVLPLATRSPNTTAAGVALAGTTTSVTQSERAKPVEVSPAPGVLQVETSAAGGAGGAGTAGTVAGGLANSASLVIKQYQSTVSVAAPGIHALPSTSTTQEVEEQAAQTSKEQGSTVVPQQQPQIIVNPARRAQSTDPTRPSKAESSRSGSQRPPMFKLAPNGFKLGTPFMFRKSLPATMNTAQKRPTGGAANAAGAAAGGAQDPTSQLPHQTQVLGSQPQQSGVPGFFLTRPRIRMHPFGTNPRSASAHPVQQRAVVKKAEQVATAQPVAVHPSSSSSSKESNPPAAASVAASAVAANAAVPTAYVTKSSSKEQVIAHQAAHGSKGTASPVDAEDAAVLALATATESKYKASPLQEQLKTNSSLQHTTLPAQPRGDVQHPSSSSSSLSRSGTGAPGTSDSWQQMSIPGEQVLSGTAPLVKDVRPSAGSVDHLTATTGNNKYQDQVAKQYTQPQKQYSNTSAPAAYGQASTPEIQFDARQVNASSASISTTTQQPPSLAATNVPLLIASQLPSGIRGPHNAREDWRPRNLSLGRPGRAQAVIPSRAIATLNPRTTGPVVAVHPASKTGGKDEGSGASSASSSSRAAGPQAATTPQPAASTPQTNAAQPRSSSLGRFGLMPQRLGMQLGNPSRMQVNVVPKLAAFNVGQMGSSTTASSAQSSARPQTPPPAAVIVTNADGTKKYIPPARAASAPRVVGGTGGGFVTPGVPHPGIATPTRPLINQNLITRGLSPLRGPLLFRGRSPSIRTNTAAGTVTTAAPLVLAPGSNGPTPVAQAAVPSVQGGASSK